MDTLAYAPSLRERVTESLTRTVGDLLSTLATLPNGVAVQSLGHCLNTYTLTPVGRAQLLVSDGDSHQRVQVTVEWV